VTTGSRHAIASSRRAASRCAPCSTAPTRPPPPPRDP
jgi:hypothetical protein